MRRRTRFARFLHAASCSSTQDLALTTEAVDGDEFSNLVVVADHQTSGRGRQQREWHDEPGTDLLATFRFRQALPFPAALPAALPVALALALEPFARRRLRIKWPNDIYLEGRKLCGMLVDSGAAGADTYLVGIGVNCNRVRFPPDLEATATSLALATGEEIDRTELLLALAERIEHTLQDLAEGHTDELLAVFRDRLGLLGQRVEVQTSGARRGRLDAIDFTNLQLDGEPPIPLGFVRGIRPLD